MAPSVEVPESVRDVIGALAGDGSVVLAGGTVVMPELNTTAHDVAALVSLRRAGLGGIEVDGGRAVIGAATTLAAVGKDERLAVLAPGDRVDRLADDPQPRDGRRQPLRAPALRRPRGRAARAGRRGRRRRPGRRTPPAPSPTCCATASARGGRHGRRLRRPRRGRLALHEGDAPQAELGLDRDRRRGPLASTAARWPARGSPSAAPARGRCAPRPPSRRWPAARSTTTAPPAAGEAAAPDAEPLRRRLRERLVSRPRPPRPRPPGAAREE